MWSAWSFGFGYDPISDDYKVVRLGQYLDLSDGHFETETLVCNLKDNAWREIPGMSYMLGIDQKMGVLVGDALHWLVSLKFMLINPNQIVGFDVRVEQFREVPAPRIFVDQNAYASLEVVTLGVVGEWLSVKAINRGAPKRLDVWVMKEYDVKESWTKLFSVTSNELSSLKCMRTLAFSNNGYELLLGLWDGNLVGYNPKEKSVRKVNLHGSLTPFVAEVFRGSLVPVGINKETDMKKDRKGRKNRKKRDDFLSKGFKLNL